MYVKSTVNQFQVFLIMTVDDQILKEVFALRFRYFNCLSKITFFNLKKYLKFICTRKLKRLSLNFFYSLTQIFKFVSYKKHFLIQFWKIIFFSHKSQLSIVPPIPQFKIWRNSVQGFLSSPRYIYMYIYKYVICEGILMKQKILVNSIAPVMKLLMEVIFMNCVI